MSHRFGNCLWDVVEVGETFRVMTMAIPSQALNEYFKEGVESGVATT